MEDLVSLAQPPLLQGMWIRIKAVIAQVPFVSGRAVRERLPFEI